MDLTGMLQAAAGAAGGENLYIEDVFSTYLYTGNGSTQTITNGIDLDGEGGLVWFKSRNSSESHSIYDSERGLIKRLFSTSTNGQGDNDINLSFSATGFSINTNQFGFNSSDPLYSSYVSWTFRKAPKFFDVVTYTGTGSARTVSHNLGSVPGCIMVKRTDTTGAWQVYHRANTANPETDFLVLNTTAATADSNTRWNDTQPTSTVFSLGTEATVNASGATYVAYLWAHDDGGFGDDGLQNVVTCGSYTGNDSTLTVNLGYEPQWIIVKRSDNTGNWALIDVMRGWITGPSTQQQLYANTSGAETGDSFFGVTATGFSANLGGTWNTNGGIYIYIAIRRGPMKTPTAGTEVFGALTRTGTGASATISGLNFPVDMLLGSTRDSARAHAITDRLRGAKIAIRTNSTGAEAADATGVTGLDRMDGFTLGADVSFTGTFNGGLSESKLVHYFQRAPGFFDVVCYTGTGSATTITHNLGVVPELIIVKKRSATDDWAVYAGDNTDFLLLNTTAATADDNTYWNDTSPTSTVFSVGTNADVNTSAATYVAYIFASLAGVSKVGTYTGNGSSVTVTTGFQPRFILVKRTDSTGNWIVGDSVRGLVAGDDPALFLNTTDAETTGQDWVDISATGFTVNETALNANVSTATYIYLCVS
jgi:hypothetical protein